MPPMQHVHNTAVHKQATVRCLPVSHLGSPVLSDPAILAFLQNVMKSAMPASVRVSSRLSPSSCRQDGVLAGCNA